MPQFDSELRKEVLFIFGEKEKKKQPGGFFPKAGHTLLGLLHGIFVAVRCN
jgi:hypothetical protein